MEIFGRMIASILLALVIVATIFCAVVGFATIAGCEGLNPRIPDAELVQATRVVLNAPADAQVVVVDKHPFSGLLYRIDEKKTRYFVNGIEYNPELRQAVKGANWGGDTPDSHRKEIICFITSASRHATCSLLTMIGPAW